MRFIRFTGSKNGEPKRERLLSKDFLLLMIAAMGLAFMNQFFLSSMPLYMDKLGGLALHAGLMSTVYSSCSVLSRPLWGRLSDRSGRFKLSVGGAAICTVACLCFSFTTVIPLLLLIRAMHGIAFGMHSTCAGAGAADVLPRSRLAEGLGYFYLYATISQAAGPGIAVAIVSGGTLKEFQTLFYTAVGICLVSTISASFVTYERKRKKLAAAAAASAADSPAASAAPLPAAPPKNDTEPLPKALLGFEYAVFLPVIVMIIFMMGIVGIMAFLAKYAIWKGLGNPGLFFVVSAASLASSRFVLGKAADRGSADRLIVPGMSGLIICLALIPFVRSMTELVILALPLGFTQGMVSPSMNAIMFKRSSPARRGTTAGGYLIAIDVGIAAGAPLLGAIADAFDYRYIFWTAAIFVALSLSLYLTVCSDRLYYKKLANSGLK